MTGAGAGAEIVKNSNRLLTVDTSANVVRPTHGEEIKESWDKMYSYEWRG